MGLRFRTYLEGSDIFGCKKCQAHLSTDKEIISRSFRGQHGKAYLFSKVANINAAEAVERTMTTGRHVVRDISCKWCNTVIGWKYDKAYEQTEKYKEDKYILEMELVCNVE